MLDELQNDFDSIGTPETAPDEASLPEQTEQIEPTPDAAVETPTSQDEQDLFDQLGVDDKLPEQEESSPPPAVAPTSDDADSPSKTEEIEAEKPDGDKESPKEEKEDWESDLAPETEEYIEKLPPNERQRARLAEKGSRMQQSYLNPNCPPEQWIENAKIKSEFRFNQIADAILAEKNAVSLEIAKTDPVKFLGEIFTRTAEGEHSETYRNLLDNVIKTNTDYAVSVLEGEGFTLKKAGENEELADLTGIANMSDAEIDELQQSEAFGQLKEVYPEDAERLQKILSEAKTLRSAKAEAEKVKETEAEKQAREKEEIKLAEESRKAEEAEAEKTKTTIQTFETVYNSNVTNHISKKLETELGLAVTPGEKESDPTFAFLKEAKKALILAGGLNGSGDFDNDLKQWGDTRPAFKQAADSMIAFARAGEQQNAAAAAEKLQPFADAFLNERLNLPEIKMLDEIMADVVFARSMKNRVRNDFVPDGIGATDFQDKNRTLQDEFDAIK